MQDTQNPFAGLSHGETAADEVPVSAHAPSKPPVAKGATTLDGARQRRLAMAAGGAALFMLLIVALIAVLNRPAPPTSAQEPPVVEAKRPRPPSILDLAAAGEKERQAQEARIRAEQRAARVKWIAGEETVRQRRATEAETPFKALAAKFKDAGATFPSFAKELTAFKAKHGGTPAALQAAEMLTKLPSPLDRLDRARIPVDARAAWKADGFDAPDVVAVIGEHRWRHWGPVYAVAITTDGKLIASVGIDRAVRVWEASSGKELHCFRGHNADISAVAFSRDGKLLASGAGGDGRPKCPGCPPGKRKST